MDLSDQFKYGLSCKLNWGYYIKYVFDVLPIILTDILARPDEEKAASPNRDGYYIFKRYDSDESKILLYTLWCVNLDYPRLRPSDIYYLEEKTEIINTTW